MPAGQIENVNDVGQIIAVFTPPPITQSRVTVPYAEWHVDNSPRITGEGDGGGTKVERDFIINFTDAATFIAQAIGFAYIANVGGTNVLRRYLPMFDQFFPWLPAVNYSLKPLNWNGKLRNGGKFVIDPTLPQSLLIFDKVIVTLQFIEPDYLVLDDATIDSLIDPTTGQPYGEVLRYVTVTGDASVDYLSIPSDKVFVWTQGPDAGPPALPVPDSPGRAIPGVSLHLRWRRVPYTNVPWQTIYNTLGTMNKYSFINAAPRTLLLLAVDRELRKQIDGSWCLDVIYNFRYLATGWDKVLDWLASTGPAFYQIGLPGWPGYPTPGGWPAGSTPDGKLIYNERDFSALFRVV